jgi:acetyl esterase/lipase
METEGWDVAHWLASHGIPAFVLKYRVLPTPAAQPEFADKMMRLLHSEDVGFAPAPDTPPEALEDGIAALRYVRRHATDYGIDADRVGFMGFSAGGFLTRSIIERGGADMPSFAAPIYPNEAAMKVPVDAPPMFVAVASDDMLLQMVRGFPLIESYRAAHRPIEFHLFASGGHGFGAGVAGTPTEGWMTLFVHWLQTQHLIGEGGH